MYGLDEYPPGYQTNPYCIEYARSGRATCQGCKDLIAKGDLRLGSPVVFGDQGVSYKWRHFRCLTGAVLNNMRGKIGRHSLEEAITGLGKLKPQDYRRVEHTLGAGGLAAAKEGASSEEEEEEEPTSSSEEEEEKPKPKKKAQQKKKQGGAEEEGEEGEAYNPASPVKTPKKQAPTRRAPSKRAAAAKRRAQEDSDEDYKPEKQVRGRRAAK
ncbi:Poly polymerase and DNA-Ligase Zn-finger region family [Chlorella sorokiniana]|uniref:Poly polymerase and DNA-Ligase Zn-finger region family n=1 Tax=Chlorella sorokiniana TaxID=3076 RepID=A0A2P6TQ70_CHLSO|nr:Poly polymerase and DNA-Ligase Zn-finger region family [Chlorella sorokiniana]|eukprot:PRW56177.1 Poly polymerase and DNA-Ligase Zn-finger region family [Chlorella sorokiniana]